MGRGGEKSLLCDPGSELRLGGREKKKGEDNKRDDKKKKNVGPYAKYYGTLLILIAGEP